MEVQEDIGRSTITQNKVMLLWTAIITVLFLPRIEKLWQHDSIALVVINLPYQKSFFTSMFKRDGFESPLLFSAFNIALKWQKSTEHNNSELETSSSTQKNVSFFPLTWSWPCLHFLFVEMLQYSIGYSNFMLLHFIFNVWVFVFNKPKLYSVLRICID